MLFLHQNGEIFFNAKVDLKQKRKLSDPTEDDEDDLSPVNQDGLAETSKNSLKAITRGPINSVPAAGAQITCRLGTCKSKRRKTTRKNTKRLAKVCI